VGLPQVVVPTSSVYPICNELMGLVSVMCHNKKIIFEKYRAEE
jgi:hypothetical protein